jgi:NAD(P)-dependent dehydrogenase (short-subunit alcohol dehydrogenase family)
MMEIAGKTAFVTGAASGIGLGIATALSRAGVKVMLCGIEDAAPGLLLIKRKVRQPSRLQLWPVQRRAFSHRPEDVDDASLGIAAMDLLRARLQGPTTRGLGPFVHRAILS